MELVPGKQRGQHMELYDGMSLSHRGNVLVFNGARHMRQVILMLAAIGTITWYTVLVPAAY